MAAVPFDLKGRGLLHLHHPIPYRRFRLLQLQLAKGQLLLQIRRLCQLLASVTGRVFTSISIPLSCAAFSILSTSILVDIPALHTNKIFFISFSPSSIFIIYSLNSSESFNIKLETNYHAATALVRGTNPIGIKNLHICKSKPFHQNLSHVLTAFHASALCNPNRLCIVIAFLLNM